MVDLNYSNPIRLQNKIAKKIKTKHACIIWAYLLWAVGCGCASEPLSGSAFLMAYYTLHATGDLLWPL